MSKNNKKLSFRLEKKSSFKSITHTHYQFPVGVKYSPNSTFRFHPLQIFLLILIDICQETELISLS